MSTIRPVRELVADNLRLTRMEAFSDTPNLNERLAIALASAFPDIVREIVTNIQLGIEEREDPHDDYAEIVRAELERVPAYLSVPPSFAVAFGGADA